MPLTFQKQQNTFRFGGGLLPKKQLGGEHFNPEQYLHGLDEKKTKLLFYEWVVQCYIYDHTLQIPLTAEQLEKFDIHSLVPQFKEQFIAGDWKRITPCIGASIDEMFLFDQMLFKQTVIFMLNRNQRPMPTLPEMAKYYVVPDEIIFPVFLRFTNTKLSHALVTDGTTHHVLNPYHYDPKRKVIQYEDNIGADSKCFLTKEMNRLQIESKFIGHNKYGDWCWEIALDDFRKVFYGTRLLAQDGHSWNSIAMEIHEDKVKKAFLERYKKL